MAFKDQMAADLATFFNANEFGESIIYNGSTIVAVIDRLAQPGFISNNVANYADVLVKKSDVPSVQYQATVQFDGCVWAVEAVKNLDEHTLLLSVKRREGYAFKG